jgi:nicotinamide mononucleotide adenylyltransferase
MILNLLITWIAKIKISDQMSIHLPQWTEEDHEKLQNVISLDRGSNQLFSEYKLASLLLRQFFSVQCS